MSGACCDVGGSFEAAGSGYDIEGGEQAVDFFFFSAVWMICPRVGWRILVIKLGNKILNKINAKVHVIKMLCGNNSS